VSGRSDLEFARARTGLPVPTIIDDFRKPEIRAMRDDDHTQRKSDLAKEFKHTKADIWEVYEQIPTGKIGAIIPGVSKLFRNLELIEDLPFVWRMVRDVIKIKSCWYYLCLFILVKLLSSLEPAASLWCVIISMYASSTFLIVLIFAA